MASLKEYAAKTGPVHKCLVCNLPQREEIDEAYRNGVQIAVITRWLRDEMKFPATDSKIRHHFRSQHHA